MSDARTKAALEKLEKGLSELLDTERYRQFLFSREKFHDYSLNNQLLILIQKPDASRVAGYKTWQQLGRQVKAGEHGLSIIRPIPCRRKETDTDGNEVERVYNAFTSCVVFDVSQTEGEPLPSICNRLEGSFRDFNEVFAALCRFSRYPVYVEEISGTANGYFSPGEKKIVIRRGLSEPHMIKTLVHEITHSILHEDCSRDRNVCEVEAESVAFTVCERLGIRSDDYSFGYIANWSEKHDTRELKASLDVIAETADIIVDALTGGVNKAAV